MKNLLVLVLVLCVLLCSCGAEDAEIPENSEISVSSSKTGPTVKKKILKLKHSLGDFDSAEGMVRKVYSVNIPFAVPEGLDNGKGENIKISEEVMDAILETCPEFDPNKNWQNWINYYSADFSFGMLEFIYYIGDIATDKVLFCNIENGFITEISTRNFDFETDEEALIAKAKAFGESHEQEKYVLKEGEEFLSEDVNYVYYYVPEKLVYGYQLFFYMDTPIGKVVNNEYFSEYFVE